MYLVFDIGGTAIKYAIMDKNIQIYNQGEFETKSLTSLEKFISALENVYRQSTHQIDGIAMCGPGVIDAKNGIIEIITAYPYLQNVCLTDLVSKACDHIPVSLENDGKCAGLAEVWMGNAKHAKDAIVIVFGTGIGSAIIKDKKIHHGAHRLAGEISTIMHSYDYKTHQILTWSDVASTKALCQKTEIKKGLEKGSVTGRLLFSWADENDKEVLDILDEYYYDIAIQLYNLQYMYDPEIICIGGGISKQPRVLEGVKNAIETIYNDRSQIVKPKVDVCKFFNEANLIGALYYFLNRE